MIHTAEFTFWAFGAGVVLFSYNIASAHVCCCCCLLYISHALTKAKKKQHAEREGRERNTPTWVLDVGAFQIDRSSLVESSEERAEQRVDVVGR
jgi:hypothetical protein